MRIRLLLPLVLVTLWLATGAARAQAQLPSCQDGVDNDDDGLVDFADPDCLDPETGAEGRAQALDGGVTDGGVADGGRDAGPNGGLRDAGPNGGARDGFDDAGLTCPCAGDDLGGFVPGVPSTTGLAGGGSDVTGPYVRGCDYGAPAPPAATALFLALVLLWIGTRRRPIG